ncbi:MAG: hypothetical protein JXR76_09025 [Deltaproteobacteria bacterium]|nr:hypothetical protein [Deltaproteobacteria bacterium]
MRWMFICAGLLLLLLLNVQVNAQTDETTDCDDGCIPFSEVKELQGDGAATRSKCAPGCVAIEEIKSRQPHPSSDENENAATVVTSAPQESGAIEKEDTGAVTGPSERLVDGRLSQLVLQPTALGLKKRQVAITGFGAGYWQGEIGVTDHFSVSAYTVVPATIAGFGLKTKIHTRLGSNAAISLSAMGIIGGPYIEGGGIFMITEVIQPTFTLVTTDKKHLLNFSFAAGGMQLCARQHLFSSDYDDDYNGYECEGLGMLLMAPRLGYRAALHRRVALSLEWLMPLISEEGDENGHIHLISYSVQIHGDLLFSDLGFLLPIWDEIADEIFQFFPIGIPYFTIGFKI